jgi:hypothetical protein
VIIFYSPADAYFIYGDAELNSQIKFRFVLVVSLESEIIGINTTTVPVDSLNEYIPPNQKLWRETIINPTAITRQKTFKEAVQVIKRETVKTDYNRSTLKLDQVEIAVQVPGGGVFVANQTKATTTSQIPVEGNEGTIYLNGSNNVRETVRTVDVSETFTVPPYTCIEAYLIMEAEKTKQQNITAHLRVSAKVNRFGSASGVIRKSKWAPGMVVEQVMKERNFMGKYVETRAYDAIFETTGKLETNRGMHSSVIAHEIDCPNSNKKY